MKISALKKMIHEEVRKAVRAELKELLSSQSTVVKESSNNVGIADLRNRFKATQNSSLLNSYEGLSQPQNERTIVNGDHYASGEGVLEWFKRSKDQTALDEHRRALEKMAETDQYVSETISRKRI